MHGRVLRPSEIQQNREGPVVGPGSRSLDEIDGAVLLFLYLQEPSRTLRNYTTQHLEELTGTVVSESTVCRWFLYAFPFRGGLCRPNLVPFGKSDRTIYNGHWIILRLLRVTHKYIVIILVLFFYAV